MKGNKRRVAQFRNEYGLYFVFATKIFEQIAEKHDMPYHRVRDFAIIYYIQRYVKGGKHINITEIAGIAQKLGFDYSVQSMRRAIKYFHERELLEFWGNRYHLCRASADFLKSYGYWLNFNLNNFNSVVKDGKTILHQRFNEKSRLARNKKRRKRSRKT